MLWQLPFKRYFKFSGRSGRAEYWQFAAVVIAVIVVVAMFDGATASPYDRSPKLSMLILLGSVVPFYAVTFRRLHDRGVSGWVLGGIWVLNGIWFAVDRVHASLGNSVIGLPFLLISWVAVLATLALAVFVLVQVCSPGDPETNRFGPPPTEVSTISMPSMPAGATTTAPPLDFANPATVDPLDQLERLSKLHRDGVLSDAEFQEQKTALLRRTQG